MIKQIKWMVVFMLTGFVWQGTVVAGTTGQGQFFNASLYCSGSKLIVTTTTSGVYPSAGIKMTNLAYSLASGCTPSNNGFCLFPVSATSSASIWFGDVAPTTPILVTLCLNGVGDTFSCEDILVPIFNDLTVGIQNVC